jgi:K+-sensing histidine kinase KdpD
MLGARLRVEQSEDVAATAIRVARELASTYVLMGTPAPSRGLARLGGATERSLLARLLRGLPGVDIRLVADPTLRRAAERPEGSLPAAGAQGHDGEEIVETPPRDGA